MGGVRVSTTKAIFTIAFRRKQYNSKLANK